MQHYEFEKEAKESKKKTDQQLDEMLGHESDYFLWQAAQGYREIKSK